MSKTDRHLIDCEQQLQGTRQQLIQSEKMATLGRLVAGVAHEINNPLCYVKTNLQTLQQYVENMDELLGKALSLADAGADGAFKQSLLALRQQLDYDYVHEELPLLLDETADGVARIEAIVSSLRDYAHDDVDQWRSADLHDLIETALKLTHNQLKYVVHQVNRDYAPLPSLCCRPAQISQVLVNLLVNAAQAMPRGGEIDIVTRQLDEHYVQLCVRDQGEGIAANVMLRLFEPFVTTKPSGKGTGLGLPICHEIISAHGGTIHAENRTPCGADFIITLPLNLDRAEG